MWCFILLCFSFWIYINYWYAQEYKETDMQAITVRFCNNGTSEEQLKDTDVVFVEPGKEKKLCLYVSNGWEKKMTFEYGFSMWTTSKGWDPVCDWDMSTGNQFSMLIPWTHNRVVTIDPMTFQVIEEKIVIPPGMNWLQLWCLAYKLSKPQFDGIGWMFNLIVRKVTHLNIVVWWESTVDKTIKIVDAIWGIFSTNKKIKAQLDDENGITLSSVVENKWNVSQNVTITGRIYNALGFQKDFAIEPKQLTPGMKYEFSTNAGILPSYKWFFTIKLNIKSDPVFLFPISNEKLKEPGYVTERGKVFIFSRMRVIILAVVLLIIYRVFVHKKIKTVVVTPTPTTI